MFAGHKFLRGFTIPEVAWAAWSSATILDVLNVLFDGSDVREEERDWDKRKNTSRDWDFSASQTMNVCISIFLAYSFTLYCPLFEVVDQNML